MYNPVKYTDPSGHSPACDGGSDQPGWCPNNSFYVSVPDIVSREEWGAAEPGSVPSGPNANWDEGLFDPTDNQEGYMQYQDSLEIIYDTIVIHHSYPFDSSSSPIEIQYAEMSDGMYDIGYHFLIDAEGTVYEGRAIDFRGLHVSPGWDPETGNFIGNTGRIGIVLIGDFTTETPTIEQTAEVNPKSCTQKSVLNVNLTDLRIQLSAFILSHFDNKKRHDPAKWVSRIVDQSPLRNLL
jgi:hypothetical protein